MTQDKANKINNWGSRFLAPLIVVMGLLIFFTPCATRLNIREHDSGRLLLSLPIEAGERFRIRFTHSVNLSYVTDEIEWTGDSLITRTSLFTSFGAGMPVIADGIGTEMKNTPEGFLITGIDETQPDNAIPIMLQDVPDHHLLYRDSEISLRELPRNSAFIKITVEKTDLYGALTARKK